MANVKPRKMTRASYVRAKAIPAIRSFQMLANLEVPNRRILVAQIKGGLLALAFDEESAREVGQALVQAADAMRSERN
jgi:hypothetical protein